MTIRSIVPIVEGQAEVDSVPVLLRRLLGRAQRYDVDVARPFRVKRNQVARREGNALERAVSLATRDRPNPVCVLVLLDADDDCPAEVAPRLLTRCGEATGLPVAVVLASKEFEGWFLGVKDSLRGVRGIRDDATPPADPEQIRGAKERLSRNMVGDRRYNEVDDQPAFADKMDIDLARKRCPSFDKLVRDFEGLLQQVPPAE